MSTKDRDHHVNIRSLANGGACGVVLGVVLSLVLLPPAQAQQSLREKLKTLNVRHETKHYRLAGTVTDERMQMYGQALEYIHREYARGFASVLKDEEKADNGADKQKPRQTNRQTKKSTTGAKAKANAEPSGNMAKEDEQDRFPVIVFNDHRQYQEFGRAFLGSSEHTIGMCRRASCS